MSLGITIPFSDRLSELGATALALEQAGFDGLWTAETAGADAFSPLVLASATTRAQLGTAVASVFARSPALLAMQSAALAEAAPGRAVIGLGASSAAMVAGWHDRAFERPRQRVIDTTRFLRAALSGERVSMDLPTFSVKGFTLERPPAHPPKIVIAALQAQMLAAAGAEADGVVLNWLGPDDVTKVVQVVQDARPPNAEPPVVVARIFVCPTDDVDGARHAAKSIIATYLSVPVYEAYQRWLGRIEPLTPMWEHAARRDRRAAADAVPDDVVDELIGIGSPAACADHIEAYRRAGVTTPVLKVLPLTSDVDPFVSACAIARVMTRTDPS